MCVGGSHSAAITVGSRLYTWGNGSYGQLGRGVAKSGLMEDPGLVEHLKYVSVVDCGEKHTVAINNAGIMYSWGDDQLSVGSCFYPTQVTGLINVRCVKASCGAKFTCCVTNEKVAFIWGLYPQMMTSMNPLNCVENERGAISKFRSSGPAPIITLLQYRFVDVSCYNSCISLLTDGGELLYWNMNEIKYHVVNRKPREVRQLQDVAKFSCGDGWLLAHHYSENRLWQKYGTPLNARGNKKTAPHKRGSTAAKRSKLFSFPLPEPQIEIIEHITRLFWLGLGNLDTCIITKTDTQMSLAGLSRMVASRIGHIFQFKEDQRSSLLDSTGAIVRCHSFILRLRRPSIESLIKNEGGTFIIDFSKFSKLSVVIFIHFIYTGELVLEDIPPPLIADLDGLFGSHENEAGRRGKLNTKHKDLAGEHEVCTVCMEDISDRVSRLVDKLGPF